MARFFVGQRVRLAHPSIPQNMGKTGRIARLFTEFPVIGGPVNCKVIYDEPVIGNFTHTDQLEPILPDGHRAGDYTNVKDLLAPLRKPHVITINDVMRLSLEVVDLTGGRA